jgi:hypothetical protein
MCCNRNNNDNNRVLNADQVIIRANRVFVMGAEDNNNNHHCRNGNVAGAEDYNRGCGNRGNVAGAQDNNRRRCCWF